MSTYHIATQLALELSQSLHLSGEPFASSDSIIIQDDDTNPTITIYDTAKVVDFKYSTDIRKVVVQGVIRMCEKAGYTVNCLPYSKKHPFEELLEKIKPSAVVRIDEDKDKDEDFKH